MRSTVVSYTRWHCTIYENRKIAPAFVDSAANIQPTNDDTSAATAMTELWTTTVTMDEVYSETLKQERMKKQPAVERFNKLNLNLFTIFFFLFLLVCAHSMFGMFVDGANFFPLFYGMRYFKGVRGGSLWWTGKVRGMCCKGAREAKKVWWGKNIEKIE